MCKYHIILYNRVEHLQIDTHWDSKTNSTWIINDKCIDKQRDKMSETLITTYCDKSQKYTAC